MRQPKADHQQAEERHVLGVEEGLRVDARMQQEEQQGKERQQTAAEQSVGQQIAGIAGDHEEQVRQQVASQIEAAALARPKSLFEQRKRHLQDRPVQSVPRVLKLIEPALASEIPQRRFADGALIGRVDPNAVVVCHGNGKQQRQPTHDQRPGMAGKPAEPADQWYP